MLVIENTHGWSEARMAEVFPSMRSNLKKVIDLFPDELTENFVFQQILGGMFQLWVVYDDSAPEKAIISVLTRIKTYDATGVKFIEVLGLGGSRIDECAHLISDIEEWGKSEHGAQRLRAIGRLGWRKAARKQGYTDKAFVMEKNLEPDHG